MLGHELVRDQSRTVHSEHTVHSAANGILTASLRHTVNAVAKDQSHTTHSVHSEHTVHSAVNDIVTASLRHTVNAIARDQSRTVHSAANDIMPHFIILARFSTSSCGFATCIRHAFDFFVEHLVANLLHKSRHVEIDAAGSLVGRYCRFTVTYVSNFSLLGI